MVWMLKLCLLVGKNLVVSLIYMLVGGIQRISGSVDVDSEVSRSQSPVLVSASPVQSSAVRDLDRPPAEYSSSWGKRPGAWTPKDPITVVKIPLAVDSQQLLHTTLETTPTRRTSHESIYSTNYLLRPPANVFNRLLRLCIEQDMEKQMITCNAVRLYDHTRLGTVSLVTMLSDQRKA